MLGLLYINGWDYFISMVLKIRTMVKPLWFPSGEKLFEEWNEPFLEAQTHNTPRLVGVDWLTASTVHHNVPAQTDTGQIKPQRGPDKDFLFNAMCYRSLSVEIVSHILQEWMAAKTASSEGRKMSPDIPNSTDCVQTSAGITKRRRKYWWLAWNYKPKRVSAISLKLLCATLQMAVISWTCRHVPCAPKWRQRDRLYI